MAMTKFKFGNLPIPPSDYSPESLRQAFRILEIYFNQLDSGTPNEADAYKSPYFYGGAFIGDGYGLKLPYIAASDTTNQYATGDNTPTAIQWNTLEAGYGFSLSGGSAATATYSGIYKVDFSLQFVNTDNANHNVFVWLELTSGLTITQVARSSSEFTVPARKNVGDNGYLIGYSSATFPITAGDSIKLYWATPKAYSTTGPVDGVYMEAINAITSPYNRPANPSAIGSIVFVSALS